MEKATNTIEIREQIKQVYQADVQAIKNLGDIASSMITEDGTLTLPYNVNITGNLNVDHNIQWYKSGTNYLGLLQRNPHDGANIKLKNKHGIMGVDIYSLYGNKEGRNYVNDKDGNHKFTVTDGGKLNVQGDIHSNSYLTTNGTKMGLESNGNAQFEMFGGTPYIDFKHNNDVDYHNRIILVSNTLNIGNVKVGSLTANDKVYMNKSCDLKGTLKIMNPEYPSNQAGIHDAISLVRKYQDANGNSVDHRWVFWHMNVDYGNNDLQIYEYNPDHTGKTCGGDAATGARCNLRFKIKGGNGDVDVPGNIYVSNAHFSVANTRDKWYSAHRHDHHGMITTWPTHGQ